MTESSFEYRVRIAVMAADRLFGVTRADLESKSKAHPLVKYRHMVLTWLRENSIAPLRVVGAAFNRDHSSVIHSMENVRDWIDTRDRLAQEYIKFCDLCNSELHPPELVVPAETSVSLSIGRAFLSGQVADRWRDRCAAPAKDAGRMIFEEPDRA